MPGIDVDVRRYIALALVLVAVVAVFAPSRRAVVRVVRPRAEVPVIVPPPLTPLEARRAHRSAAGRSPDSARGVVPKTRLIPQTVSRKPQTRPLPSRKRQTAKTRPDRRPSRPEAQKPPSGSNPPSAPPKQCPPVNIGAPVPFSVTTPVAGVNC